MTQGPRLNLIQRAAGKLANPVSAPPLPAGAPEAEGDALHRSPAPVMQQEALASIAPPAPPPMNEAAADPEIAGADPIRVVSLKFAEWRRGGMITPDNITSHLSNEFRRIKREVLLRARDPETRKLANNLVMITSSLPREGKTFTALNLAISLATERDVHVLLIDGDAIHPCIEPMFEGTVNRGLLDLLAGRYHQVSEVIYRCEEAPNLSMIFAGTSMANAPELMASRRMAEVCVDLSTRYPDRIIIIDTPPVLASAEPGMIAMHVHQVIMVVAAERTDRADLHKAVEQVSGCRNISLLLNKAPSWHQLNRSSYYGYYRDGSAVKS